MSTLPPRLPGHQFAELEQGFKKDGQGISVLGNALRSKQVIWVETQLANLADWSSVKDKGASKGTTEVSSTGARGSGGPMPTLEPPSKAAPVPSQTKASGLPRGPAPVKPYPPVPPPPKDPNWVAPPLPRDPPLGTQEDGQGSAHHGGWNTSRVA